MAASTVIRGSRATDATQGILQDARVIDMSDVIHLLDPNEAPLTAVSMKLRTVSAINPEIKWQEDDYIPDMDQIDNGAGYAAGATSLVVDNGDYFRAGDVVLVLRTAEVMLVTAVDTGTDTLTVTRSVGTTAAAALVDDDELVIIGNANVENSTSRTVVTALKVSQNNFCQIFRWEFGASGTLQSSELYGGDDLAYQQRKAGKEFRIQMERAYVWGEKAEDTSGNTPRRYCGGIIERIGSSNITTATGGNLDISTMEAFLRDGFRYGPARKMLFASRLVVSILSEIADAKLESRPTDKTFPLALTEYVSPHGKLYIATHNLLTSFGLAVGSGYRNEAYGGWALLLDLDSIYHRPLRDRNTMLRTNIQANDADGRIDGYLAECCPQTIQSNNHRVLNNVQQAA